MRRFDDPTVEKNLKPSLREQFLDSAAVKIYRQGLMSEPLALRSDKIIGSGEFSIVTIGVLNKQIVACKWPKDRDKSLILLLNETRILSTLDCPQVVKYHGHGFLKLNPTFCLVLSLEMGNLDVLLRKSIYPAFKHKLSLDITLALCYLRERRIIHRDLKTDNILYSIDDGNINGKISDFGHAIECFASEVTSENCAAGARLFRAPEQLLNQPITLAYDLYQFAYILLLIYQNQSMSNLNSIRCSSAAETIEVIVENSCRPEVSKEVPSHIKFIIKQNFSRDPTARILPDDIKSILKAEDCGRVVDELKARYPKPEKYNSTFFRDAQTNYQSARDDLNIVSHYDDPYAVWRTRGGLNNQ